MSRQPVLCQMFNEHWMADDEQTLACISVWWLAAAHGYTRAQTHTLSQWMCRKKANHYIYVKLINYMYTELLNRFCEVNDQDYCDACSFISCIFIISGISGSWWIFPRFGRKVKCSCCLAGKKTAILNLKVQLFGSGWAACWSVLEQDTHPLVIYCVYN